jgi:hypothetical protein
MGGLTDSPAAYIQPTPIIIPVTGMFEFEEENRPEVLSFEFDGNSLCYEKGKKGMINEWTNGCGWALVQDKIVQH